MLRVNTSRTTSRLFVALQPCTSLHRTFSLFTSSRIKKDLSHAMEKSYDPQLVEKDWYNYWESQGYFKPDNDEKKKPFSMVLPPPNVTGSLHIGHALNISIQDTLARYKKMRGYDVLWVPGTDHAGISTQVVVEKKIFRETGQTRYDFGRKDFIDKVWEWKQQYGNQITQQIRALGAMTDWSKERFTMDKQLSESVSKTFVKLYNDGLVYRDTRLVNWCPALNTALSDIEVDHVSVTKKTKLSVPSYDKKVDFGVLHTFKYPVVNSKSDQTIIGHISVSTTRIETMLGDSAVAIHPHDERYKSYHGKFILHPITQRVFPIVLDPILVDPTFGTGAVKITPAHDQNDYACGKRHNLEMINIMNRNGTFNEQSGYPGVNRFQVRYSILKKLQELDLYVSEQDHAMEIPICSRSGDVIEPLLIPQWFVKCEELAKKVLENGVSIHQESSRIIWQRWLEGIHDWCISRQLWWGHQIPAYRMITKDGEKWIIAETKELAIEQAEKMTTESYTLEQDEDVLDTWFSSGIYPLSALGPLVERFYPLSVMETGSDILFFWVARMMMLCTYLHSKPFDDIYLHAIIRDQQGRKMSKSLGNVIDPMDVIHGVSFEKMKEKIMTNTNVSEKQVESELRLLKQQFPKGIESCGTDALRFTLIQYTQQERQINLEIQRIVSNRHFCNKIWQAARFTLMNEYVERQDELGFTNEWILGKLNETISQVTQAMDRFQFSEAASCIQSFFILQFCDVYLEIIKPVLYSKSKHESTVWTLYYTLTACVKLLHPFMPFITEEIWQRITHGESIMIEKYPEEMQGIVNRDGMMNKVLAIVQELRSIKHSLQLPGITAYVATDLSIEEHVSTIMTLTKAQLVEIVPMDFQPTEKMAVRVIDQCTIYVSLPSDISERIQVELSKLEEKEKQLYSNIQKYEKILAGLAGKEGIETVKDSTQKKLQDAHDEIPKVKNAILEMKKLL